MSAPAGDDPYATIPPSPGLAAIVAVGRGGAIGRANGLPWHIPEELAHFKRVTTGHAVIMGLATYRSIGRALPGRQMIVLTRRRLKLPDPIWTVGSIDEALHWAAAHDPAPLVIGGAQVYAEVLPELQRLWWTDVDVGVPDADAWFPAIDEDGWVDVARWSGQDPRLTYRVRDRRDGPRPAPPSAPSPAR